MKNSNMNHRNTWMALSLVLLAGASRLAGQTAQNPVLVVFGSNPDAIQFSHQIGTTNPLPQSVRVYSGPPNVPFTATANPQTVGGWLFVNGALTTSGTTAVQGQQDLSISVTPQGLAAGSYTGTVNIVAGSTTRSLNVLLTVSGSPQLRISPASMPDQTVERNGAVTLPLTVASTSGTAIPYTVIVAAQEPLTNWLSVSAPVPQTGQPAQVTINAALIPATTTLAIGALRFTSPSNGQVTLPISVIVTPGAQLQTSPNNINFPYEIGRTTPSAKGVTVTSSTQTQILYGATVTSNSPWLTLSQSPNGPGSMTVSSLTTPSVLYLIPNIGAVPATPATLDATVVISQPGGTVSRTITARLIISNQAQFTLTQDSAQFSYTLGGVLPNPASISLGSTSIPLQFTTASTFTTGGAFFSATPTSGATPQNLTISLDPTRVAALTAGTYTGSVRVTSTSGASPIDIPVTFTVSGSALLTVDNFQPDPFEGAQGQALAERSVVVRSTDSSNQPFTVNVEYGTGASNWLILSPSSGSTGTTSGVIRLNVNTQPPLPPGSYTATLVITPTGVPSAPALRIPIRYNVTGSINVTANPLKLDLTQIGNTPPAVQTITLASTTSNSTYIAQSSQPWIRLVAGSTIPGSISVTFDTAGFAPGDYSGNIAISVQNPSQVINIPVTLKVTAAANLTVAPSSLNFGFTQGGTVPAAQTLNLSSSGLAIPFTAAASTANGVSWLIVNPASGTTGATGTATTPVTVTVNPQGLAPGTYPGTITLTPSNGAGAAVPVNVTLVVSVQSAPTGINLTNSATGLSRGVSPGEIITIKGRNMSPATGVVFSLLNGIVPTLLGEVRVFFDGIEAPLLYVGPAGDRNGDQINAIVPYSVGGRVSTRLVVQYRSAMSDPLELRVVEADPGLFTANQSGTGPGAILNQNSSANSTANAATLGSVIQIFGTGAGALTPATLDGRVTPNTAPFPRPLQPVTVRINGQPAEVTYAGAAPGLVGGVMQVNAVIPRTLSITAPTNVSVEVQVGTTLSQPSVTVAVRP